MDLTMLARRACRAIPHASSLTPSTLLGGRCLDPKHARDLVGFTNPNSSTFSTRCLTSMTDSHTQPSALHDPISPQQILAEILAIPKWGAEMKKLPVNREEMSAKRLFHRSIVAQLRQPGSRMVNKIRKRGWIPLIVRGRGRFPDLQIQTDPAPFIKDYVSSLYCHQRFGKTILQGPLYELRIESGGLNEFGELMDISDVPFERIRVMMKNVQIHFMKDEPVSFGLIYAPEDEPVRVRLPIRCINTEKSPGLRESGWLNQIKSNIEVRVEPYVKPPLDCTLDVGGLRMKEKLRIGDILLEGRGNGITPILPDDTITTMVSKV